MWLLTHAQGGLKRAVSVVSADLYNSLSRRRTVMCVGSVLVYNMPTNLLRDLGVPDTPVLQCVSLLLGSIFIYNMPTILQNWEIHISGAPHRPLAHYSSDEMCFNEFLYYWEQFWYITCQALTSTRARSLQALSSLSSARHSSFKSVKLWALLWETPSPFLYMYHLF